MRIPVPAQELHIDAIRDGDMYLRTSPEFHMKRLLSDGADKIFQIGSCFRAGEKGPLHNPEFTMLEWYHVDYDYNDVLQETKLLIRNVCSAVHGVETFQRHGISVDLSADWADSTVSSLFNAHAGWDPLADYDPDRFDLDLVNIVEPALPKHRAVVMRDYPSQAAAFARMRPGTPPVAERWELYLAGVELGNAYSELTDAGEQRRRLELIAEQRKELGKEVYDQDQEFLAAMDRGLPPCAGVAIGIDRLVMLLSDADSIHLAS